LAVLQMLWLIEGTFIYDEYNISNMVVHTSNIGP